MSFEGCAVQKECSEPRSGLAQPAESLDSLLKELHDLVGKAKTVAEVSRGNALLLDEKIRGASESSGHPEEPKKSITSLFSAVRELRAELNDIFESTHHVRSQIVG